MSVHMNEHMKTHPDIQFNTEGWEVGVQTNSLTSHYHNPCKRFTPFRYSVEQSFCSPGDGTVDTGEGRLEREKLQDRFQLRQSFQKTHLTISSLSHQHQVVFLRPGKSSLEAHLCMRAKKNKRFFPH